MNTARIGPPGTPVERQVRLERVDLPAERVAPHHHVQAAELLLVRPPVQDLVTASRIIPAHEP